MILFFHERNGFHLNSRSNSEIKHFVIMSENWTLHLGQFADSKSTKLSRDSNHQYVFNSDSTPDYLTFQRMWEKRSLEITLLIASDFSSYEVISCTLRKSQRRQKEIIDCEKDAVIQDFPFLRRFNLVIVN